MEPVPPPEYGAGINAENDGGLQARVGGHTCELFVWLEHEMYIQF